MNSEQVNIIQTCVSLSEQGSASFGDIVVRLTTAGIERYHADYTRMETTFYNARGDSHIVTIAISPTTIANEFSASQIETAVRKAQRGEVNYSQFTHLAFAAGCVGYFVQLTGKCVQYFGRNGEIHTEWFPGAQRK